MFKNIAKDFRSQLLTSFALPRLYCSVPKFPDPPCGPVDPYCMHVDGSGCNRARQTLKLELPCDPNVKTLNDIIKKCCVARNLHKNPCNRKSYKGRAKDLTPPKPFRSMWEPPKDFKAKNQKRCKGMLPRFDEIYYKPSNKYRCYQRTWTECPKIRIKPKKLCCLDGIEPPEVQRVVKPHCPETACALDMNRMRQMCGTNEEKQLCPKIQMPCCSGARCPPRCFVVKNQSDCIKLSTPYPSFSETKRPHIRPKRYRECQCDPSRISMCDVWQEFRRRQVYNLKQI